MTKQTRKELTMTKTNQTPNVDTTFDVSTTQLINPKILVNCIYWSGKEKDVQIRLNDLMELTGKKHIKSVNIVGNIVD